MPRRKDHDCYCSMCGCLIRKNTEKEIKVNGHIELFCTACSYYMKDFQDDQTD
jgi:hypothetical protein